MENNENFMGVDNVEEMNDIDANINNEETADNKEKAKSKSKTKKKKSSSKSKSDKLTVEVEELRTKLAEVQDKHLRLFSEFDNYRKRTSREKLEMISVANENLIKNLLPVLDDIDRSILAFEQTDDIDAVKTGTLLIFDKFRKILSSAGVKEIQSTGEEFNDEVFDAVANFPTEDKEMKNKVIDTTEKGYMLNDKVIRHPKVVVGC